LRPSLDTLFLGLIQPQERFAVHELWLKPLQGDAAFDFDDFALLCEVFVSLLLAAGDFLAVVLDDGFAASAFCANAGGRAATDVKERTLVKTRLYMIFIG
jgi:hypothetical protein